MTTPKEWLTLNDVAIALKLSRKSVSRLIQSGTLQAKNVSVTKRVHWRIHPQWIEDFKAACPAIDTDTKNIYLKDG